MVTVREIFIIHDIEDPLSHFHFSFSSSFVHTSQHSLFYVGGARVRGQRICVCAGAMVTQRSTGWRLRCTDCCKVVPGVASWTLLWHAFTWGQRASAV